MQSHDSNNSLMYGRHPATAACAGLEGGVWVNRSCEKWEGASFICCSHMHGS